MSWNWCWNWWRNGDDNLTGSSGRDWLFGGWGKDTIAGGDGNDRLFGGRGDDTIYGGNGNDRIYGGRGDDHIDGDDGNDRIYGGRGNDHIDGGNGNDRIYGGRDDDHIYGGDGNDRISGGRGDDHIDGDDGNDRIYGGRGNDHIDGGAGNDKIIGGSGDDHGYYSVAENQGSKDYYNGGRGNDHLVLKMTAADYKSGDVQADLARFEAFLAGNGHGWGHHGHSFQFEAFDLKVKNWESFELITDPSGNNDPVAQDDTVIEDAVVIQEVDPDTNDSLQSAQTIDRADFRIAPTENVGDDSLPRVSIEGTIDPGLDTDVYAFELQAGETLILDIDFTGMPIPAPDTLLYVFDATGTQVAFNDDAFPSEGGAGSNTQFDSYLEYPVTATGTYYVSVQSFAGSSTGPYTLNVSIGSDVSVGSAVNALNVSVGSTADDLGGFEILASTLLDNDSDPDSDSLEIISVDNAINGSVELTTSGDVFFTPNSVHAASFEYTLSDGQGGESIATVTVNGNSVDGLVGTSGNDLFTGGDGNDTFVFAPGSGDDTVANFTVGADLLMLTGGMTASFDEQGNDTLVNFDTGDSVLLVGVTGVVDVNDLLA